MKKYGYKSLEKKDKLTKKEVQEFWKNPIDRSKAENNQPINYLKGSVRSEYLVKLIDQYLLQKYNSRILEVGCNVGRNLNFLHAAGYTDLVGIEINEKAIALMRTAYPDLDAFIFKSSIEDVLPGIESDSYDLIFTMAVLEHIHYESDFIFFEIARISKKYIITIEDEITEWSERHFPRNYKKVFENGEWKQVYGINGAELGFLDDRFWVRVFKRE